MAREDTQFKKGQSGNPGGRAKGKAWIHKQLIAICEPVHVQEFFDSLMKGVRKGNPGMIREFRELFVGKQIVLDTAKPDGVRVIYEIVDGSNGDNPRSKEESN